MHTKKPQTSNVIAIASPVSGVEREAPPGTFAHHNATDSDVVTYSREHLEEALRDIRDDMAAMLAFADFIVREFEDEPTLGAVEAQKRIEAKYVHATRVLNEIQEWSADLKPWVRPPANRR